jgi:hypothetical protein
MRTSRLHRWTACCALATLLAGCGTVQVQPQPQLPPPLIDQLPVTVGVYYPQEFREYTHKETRYQVDYEFSLGPAHVTKLNRLLGAMFARVVEVEDLAEPLKADPSIVMVLEPRFEDYAFLTPRDMVGEAYTVTIRYRLNLYDPRGERVDGFVFTGYGRQKSGALTGTGPLIAATQRAMRDAGAKLAVELPEQESVRALLAGEHVAPRQSEEEARRDALGSFGDPAAAKPEPGPTAIETDGHVEPAREDGGGDAMNDPATPSGEGSQAREPGTSDAG